MTYKLIKNTDYILVVDDSEIKTNGYYLDDANSVRLAITSSKSYWSSREHYKKIIAHLPLNSPILEGVDLLPPIEDDVEELANIFSNGFQLHLKLETLKALREGFKAGYKKAKEKYKYTEEDVIKAIDMARELEDSFRLIPTYNTDVIIQSLHQYPTEFETVDEYPVITDDDYFLKEEKSTPRPKTITTAQGRQWVGKYKWS